MNNENTLAAASLANTNVLRNHEARITALEQASNQSVHAASNGLAVQEPANGFDVTAFKKKLESLLEKSKELHQLQTFPNLRSFYVGHIDAFTHAIQLLEQ